MRAVAALLAIAVVLVAAGTPALAHPFPKTEKAVREIRHETLDGADEDLAGALLAARDLVREARKAAKDVVLPTLPGLPGPGPAIEVRASLKQPGIQGQSETLHYAWVGAASGAWRGAYWIQSSEGTTTPGLTEIDQNGVVFALTGGALSTASSVQVTYHFLALDGAYTVHEVGSIPLLPEPPETGRADVGGAHATPGSASHPASILLTPWNLVGRNATIGLTLLADGAELASHTAPACEDIEATETEPGCRLLYALPLDASLTSVQVWHLENGSKVVDRELTRAQLLAGHIYAG